MSKPTYLYKGRRVEPIGFTLNGEPIPRDATQTGAGMQLALDQFTYDMWFGPDGEYLGDDCNGLGLQLIDAEEAN